MRTAAWIVGGLLLVAALALMLWPAALGGSSVPPGQFPIDAPQFQWPLTTRVAPYHPTKGTGTNRVEFNGAPAAKVTCALQ